MNKIKVWYFSKAFIFHYVNGILDVNGKLNSNMDVDASEPYKGKEYIRRKKKQSNGSYMVLSAKKSTESQESVDCSSGGRKEYPCRGMGRGCVRKRVGGRRDVSTKNQTIKERKKS
jgi:hypothetical protein